jgi:ubiquinol-cytochrome c reductase cytochrome b subunit
MSDLFEGSSEPQTDAPQTGEPEHDAPSEGEMPFFPDFALREALVALVFLCVLILVASITKPGLEPGADPSAAGYVPRPEWYFLWLFQSLKYFKGEMEMIGTFILPTIAIGLLVAVPFIDRRQRRLHRLVPKSRPVRLWPRFVGAGLMILIGVLTFAAYTSPTVVADEGTTLTAVEATGQAIFEKMGCASCHAIGGAGGTRAPDLTDFGTRPDAENKVLLHFTGVGTGDSMMPGYELSDAELSSLAAYLMTLKGK